MGNSCVKYNKIHPIEIVEINILKWTINRNPHYNVLHNYKQYGNYYNRNTILLNNYIHII
jgi:hypothetical protein